MSPSIPNDVALLAQAGNQAALALMVPKLEEKARYVALAFSETHVDPRDLVQDGVLAAFEALASWDPAKSTFETYSQNVMRPAMNEAMSHYYIGASIPRETLKRYWKAIKSTDSENEAVEFLEGLMRPETFLAAHRVITGTKPAHLVEGIGYEGAVSGEEGADQDTFYYAQAVPQGTDGSFLDSLILEDHLEGLTPRERLVIEGFLRGDKDTEMGRALGLDRSTISIAKRAALAKIKTSIERESHEE